MFFLPKLSTEASAAAVSSLRPLLGARVTTCPPAIMLHQHRVDRVPCSALAMLHPACWSGCTELKHSREPEKLQTACSLLEKYSSSHPVTLSKSFRVPEIPSVLTDQPAPCHSWGQIFFLMDMVRAVNLALVLTFASLYRSWSNIKDNSETEKKKNQKKGSMVHWIYPPAKFCNFTCSTLWSHQQNSIQSEILQTLKI